MSKKTFVWSKQTLPPRLPITSTAVVWLLLDYTNAVGWVQGVIWTLVGIWWIAVVVALFKVTTINPFEEDGPQDNGTIPAKSRWQQRLEKLRNP